MDDAHKRDSGASEQTPPKIKAEDNPWYLLATLYGVPERMDQGLNHKNRRAWNRYFAANLHTEIRERLVEEERYLRDELTPFAPQELPEIERAFVKRTDSMKHINLPERGSCVDFTNVQFDHDVSFAGYVFTQSSFSDVIFLGGADFASATFSGMAVADFDGAIFSGVADFRGATFSGVAGFKGATFSSRANFDGAKFSRGTSFFGAKFSRGVTLFSRGASFFGATFSDVANFGGATFSGVADFGGATFSSRL